MDLFHFVMNTKKSTLFDRSLFYPGVTNALSGSLYPEQLNLNVSGGVTFSSGQFLKTITNALTFRYCTSFFVFAIDVKATHAKVKGGKRGTGVWVRMRCLRNIQVRYFILRRSSPRRLSRPRTQSTKVKKTSNGRRQGEKYFDTRTKRDDSTIMYNPPFLFNI